MWLAQALLLTVYINFDALAMDYLEMSREPAHRKTPTTPTPSHRTTPRSS